MHGGVGMQELERVRFEILINPKASSGRGLRVWREVKKILDSRKISYRKHILKAPGAAIKVTASLTSHLEEGKECHLLVLGGDGTLNEVINGIQDFRHTILSCLQTGSGNDFARNVGVEKDAAKALENLLDHPMEVSLDYGLVFADDKKPRRFLISCGAGYDADICEEVSKGGLKKFLNWIGLGKLVYLVIGVCQIFTRENTPALLYLDDNAPIRMKKFFFVAGMQHEREGGGVPFCPDADPTDGKMDVCLVYDMPKWKIFLGIALVYAKKHTIFKNVKCCCCKTMRLVAEKPQSIHLDGETPGKASEILWACKGRLRFVK